MRATLFVTLAVFRAASLFAQPALSEEILSDPLPLQPRFANVAAPAVAMARDGIGVAIAWTALNKANYERVYMARIDSFGHVNGGVVELPLYAGTGWTAEADAFVPSLAPARDGYGFVIAWLQSGCFAACATVPKIAVYCLLDANLTPSQPVAIAAVTSPVLVRSGTDTWVAAGGRVWMLQPDGSLAEKISRVPAAADMVVVGTNVLFVSSASVKTGGICTCGEWFSWVCRPECTIDYYSYRLDFVASESTYTSVYLQKKFRNDHGVAIQSDGRDVLVVWFNGDASYGGEVDAARIAEPASAAKFSSAVAAPLRLGSFGIDPGSTVPSIATDGDRYVVVWRTFTSAGPYGGGSHDIVGAVIDREGIVTPLPIATSPAEELDPSIISLGPGTFLVAYEKRSGDRRIAGRILRFPARRRALR